MKNFWSHTHASNEIMEIITSICSLKLKTEILFLSIAGGFGLGAFTGFVGNWIFDPAESYFALIGLIACDHGTGVWIAFKHNRFETRKALRIFWTVLSHTGLLLFATNLSKGSSALFWLNEGVFVPLVLVNLISLVKNLALLGFIKNDFAKFFYTKIDAYKNQFIEKDEIQNNDNAGAGGPGVE